MLFKRTNVAGPTEVTVPWAPWPLANQWLQSFAREHGMTRTADPIPYRARVRLARSPGANRPIRGPFDWDGAADGDSYLTNPKPSAEFAIGINGLYCPVKFNSQNRMSHIELENINSSDVVAVLKFAHSVGNSLAFTLGMATNFPVFYDAVLVRSDDDKEAYLDAYAPAPTVNVGNGDAIWLTKPLRAVASLFLEGIRSSSPFHRFLCFFNVTLRINDVIKRRLRTACLDAGAERPKLNGVLSKDGVIDVVAPERIGTKYTDLIDEYRSEYRNAIAHFDPNDRLVPFDLQAEARVRTAAIVMSVISRDLLDQLAAALRDLAARGIDVESLDFDSDNAERETPSA